jgi:Mn-dependent DtxR family transcriptional regulator
VFGEVMIVMELRASGEDYLEAVLILGQRMNQVRAIDVAQYLGYAKTSVSHGLRLLRQGGFLTRDVDGYLHLTETGQETAKKIYAKHRFWAWGTVLCMVMVMLTGYKHK